MNSLIILPEECVDPTEGILSGNRAAYAYDTHGLRKGQSVKIAILGGRKGTGIVESASRDRVEILISANIAPSTLYPVDLIVGVSRPQTVKKVIQAASILGARSLHFVRSENGEKSYLQSQALQDDEVQFEVIKGLEQVWEALPPTVVVHRNFQYFLEHHLPFLDSRTPSGSSLRLIAHPGGEELSSKIRGAVEVQDQVSVVMAIGPERGWSVGEVEEFVTKGFTQIGLGERVMRVELATVFLFGQLHALYRLC